MTDDEIAEIVRGFLTVQARSAAEQSRPLARGTHPKGVSVRGSLEVLDVREGCGPAARLARGVYARPGTYPATVRFANSSPYERSDWVPDVRGLAFAVDLGATGPAVGGDRQDYSLLSAPTLPFNDPHEFVVFARVSGAPSEAIGLGSLRSSERAVYAKTRQKIAQHTNGPIRAYQTLRYWSTVPFRQGSSDVIKYSALPRDSNPAQPLVRENPDALIDELLRHVDEDDVMSSWDLGVQFLDTERMTFRGRRRSARFWIENASIEWPEAQAPFHTVARLTLLPRSGRSAKASARSAIDVYGNSLGAHAPVGSINRARAFAESASKQARLDQLGET